MPVRLGRFEMPKRLTKEDSTATETYAKFIAEPFETGYGHTVGNSLRRVLLSSLQSAYARPSNAFAFGEQRWRSSRLGYPAQTERRVGQSQPAHLHAR